MALTHIASRLKWLAAGVGCALADTIFNPLEFLKVRRQLEGAHGATVARIASTAFAAEGLYGLWQPGLLATWLRGLSYTGFRIGLYPRCECGHRGQDSSHAARLPCVAHVRLVRCFC